jgi:hypothetical protein
MFIISPTTKHITERRNKILELGLRERVTVEIIDHVQPTHFITLSLNQARRIISDGHHDTWLRGDDAIYSETHRGFIRSLSKRLTSRTSWKIHRKELRSACAVEGGSNGLRNHLHMIVAKPDDVAEAPFRIAVFRAAAGNSWIMNGDHAINIQGIRSSLESVRSAFYSVKRGVDRLSLS